MSWKPAAVSDLQKQVETLSIRLLRANSELQLKQIYCERLEYLLHQRCEMIDELAAKLGQSRLQVQHLSLQNEILLAMIAAPPVEAAMLAAPHLDANRLHQRNKSFIDE